MKTRFALFWVFTQRGMVIPYRRFGTTYRSCLQGSRSPGRLLFDCLYVEDGTYRSCRNVSRNQWRNQEFCSVGGFNKCSWGQRTDRTGIWGR